MSPAAFDHADYEKGFLDLRSALLERLQLQDAQHNPGSWLIGAYCALVQVVWETRDPGADAVKVGAILASVLADVLAEGEGRPPADDPLAHMVDAMRAAAIACSPRDPQGVATINGDQLLQACARMAAQLLAGVPDPHMRGVIVNEFLGRLGEQVDQLAEGG